MTTVREAAPEDAEAVMAAHVAAIEAFGPEAYDDEQAAAWAERPDGAAPYRESARGDSHFVVAEREGEVAGFGHLEFPEEDADHGIDGTDEDDDSDGDDEDEGEVTAVYVHPDHGRAGVGSTLLEHLEETARERGLRALGLWSSLNAAGFYERHGYERVREDVHETTGGVELGVVVMRKELE